MNARQESAAAASGPDIPDFATLAADPEIAPLLDFEPAQVKRRPNGWDADAQRAFIALVAVTGSKPRAVAAIGRQTSSIDRILQSERGAGLQAAFDGALALFKRREAALLAQGVTAAAERRDGRMPARPAQPPLPGQIVNEHGEYEDEASYRERGEEARDSVSNKLLRSRRLFLQDIADDPAKRAAFEILTELPIDWARAAESLPQADEPWRKPNMRSADMLLTAENGWLGAEFVHGSDKKAELLREVNAWRAEQGLDPVGWRDE